MTHNPETEASPLVRSQLAAFFVFVMLSLFALLSASGFAYQAVYEIEPGMPFRSTPGGWLHLSGHALRAIISGFLADALGRYIWAVRQWRQSPDSGIRDVATAISLWWLRFAVGILLMLAYVGWSWISIMFPADPYMAHRYQQPKGLPSIKIEFYAASDQPGEGFKRELLPDVGVPVYRKYEPFLTNADLANVKATIDVTGQPALGMVLTEEGAAKMRQVTRNSEGQRVLLMIDDAPTTAPYLRGEIGDSLIITGNLNAKEVEAIARGAMGRE